MSELTHLSELIRSFQKEMSCTVQDMNCILAKLLSCVVDIEQAKAETISQALQPPQTETGAEGEENLPKRRYLPEGSQGKMLSFVGCLLQSMQAGVAERKGSALLAAKKVQKLIDNIQRRIRSYSIFN